MLNRFAWNCFSRRDRASPWNWLAAGETYGAANVAGLLREPRGERVVLFGAVLPDADGTPRATKGIVR